MEFNLGVFLFGTTCGMFSIAAYQGFKVISKKIEKYKLRKIERIAEKDRNEILKEERLKGIEETLYSLKKSNGYDIKEINERAYRHAKRIEKIEDYIKELRQDFESHKSYFNPTYGCVEICEDGTIPELEGINLWLYLKHLVIQDLKSKEDPPTA